MEGDKVPLEVPFCTSLNQNMHDKPQLWDLLERDHAILVKDVYHVVLMEVCTREDGPRAGSEAALSHLWRNRLDWQTHEDLCEHPRLTAGQEM